MRATQMMQFLQELIAEHGDLDVVVGDPSDVLETTTTEDLTYTEFVKKGQFSQAFVIRTDSDEGV